jgi:hypothetical protein
LVFSFRFSVFGFQFSVKVAMSRWVITNPWVFYGGAGALVAYLLYTMVRKRKGERVGEHRREPDL